MRIAFIDFEFNNTSERDVNPVCCSWELDGKIEEFWLHHQIPAKTSFADRIRRLQAEGVIFASWSAEAEARTFLALGVNPLDNDWICLMTEYRQLLNHNHKMAYGKQLIKGKEKFTKPPKNKWAMDDDDIKKAESSKPEYNLVAATYKLSGVKIDSAFKDETRDLIISAPPYFTEEEKEQIQNYCTSDIKYLKSNFKAILAEYRRLLNEKEYKKLKGYMFSRGEYNARTALMVKEGYGFDPFKTRNFCDHVPDIIYEVQRDINEQFPNIVPFRTHPKTLKTTWDQKVTRSWVEGFVKRKGVKWRKTKRSKKFPNGQLSLSKDAFKDFFNYSHDYPRGNFGAQMVRYLNLKQQLNGFLPTGKSKKNFWDYVGSDNKVRSHFGIYGSQSSRSQPSATGFLFLKSAWMRALCVPPEDYMYVGLDYASQEFYLAALLSGDKNMIAAYLSGDPYLYFAKLAGAVPWDGKREDHEEIRDLFKSTTLGLSYGMGKFLLAIKLSEDTGKEVSEDKAQELILKFKMAFPVYDAWKKKILAEYKIKKKLMLPDGWFLFGDNDNEKSVNNFPVQGFGAAILRKAVAFAQDRGIPVVKTLHDAVYARIPLNDWAMVDKFADCLQEAFKFYLPEKLKTAGDIRLDGNAWGAGVEEGKIKTPKGVPMKCQPVYIDGRGKNEYNKFKKYFEPMDLEI